MMYDILDTQLTDTIIMRMQVRELEDENASLRYQLSLHQQKDHSRHKSNGVADIVTRLVRQTEHKDSNLAFLQIIIDSLPQAIFWKDSDLVYQGANQVFATTVGLDSPDHVVGKSHDDLPLPSDVLESLRHSDRRVIESGIPEYNSVESLITPQHEQRWLRISKIPLHSHDGRIVGLLGIFEDITDSKKLEEALHKAQEEQQMLQETIIEAQQMVIRELSSPLLPLTDNVVALPLIGAIDSARAQHIMETLLEGISTSHVTTAIIDITGLKVVDTHVAQALVRTAQAARLLGAHVILTGIQPQIAQTLVQLGADMKGGVTCSTLQRGIAYAMRG